MSRAPGAPRTLLLGVALLGASSIAAAPASAQEKEEQIPRRPQLEAGADTNDWQAYYHFGVSHLRQRPDRATAALHWATRLAPDRAEPLYARWAATWVSRRTLFVEYMNGKGADTPAARAVDSLQTLALLRNPFVHQGLERYLEAAKNDREYGPGQWEWKDSPETQGWVEYTGGKFDRAAAEFAQAIRQNPERTELRVYRARALAGQQQYDSAAAELTAALEAMRRQDRKRLVYAYDSKAMFEYSLGALHVLRRDYAAARAAYGRAVEEDLTFHVAHAALAKLALVEGDTARGVSAFEAALTANPADPVVHHDLGVVLLVSGRASEAAEHLGRTVALAPDWAAARYNLAVALDHAGRPAEASAQYAAFVARAPRSLAERAAAARERIAVLAAAGPAK